MLYDVIILGAGPAGLSAALYAGRACLKTLLIEKAMPGGQITLTNDIENSPGQLLEGESGFSLTERMSQQADKFGVERAYDEISAIESEREKAIAYHDRILPYLSQIRSHVDALEMIVDDDMWPLPKYRELLFIH